VPITPTSQRWTIGPEESSLSAYSVYLHREDSHESIGSSFEMLELPYPGLRILHESSEWEVKRVRLHVRSKNSVAALNNEPRLVDVLVAEADGMFA
jgi:hypothetical protein